MIPSTAKRPSHVGLRLGGPASATRPHLGPFIGREELLARIRRTLEDGARLVTLLGPPGIGKTRVAQRVLELEKPRAGGAWFCDLREARSALGLAHAAASLWPALEPAHATDEDALALVSEHFAAAGPMLLVLDNFEQLVGEDAPAAVRRWCLAAPELTVIVTSRERLGVEGEVVIELSPLDCPREGALPAEVLACEAVLLVVVVRELVVRGGAGLFLRSSCTTNSAAAISTTSSATASTRDDGPPERRPRSRSRSRSRSRECSAGRSRLRRPSPREGSTGASSSSEGSWYWRLNSSTSIRPSSPSMSA